MIDKIDDNFRYQMWKFDALAKHSTMTADISFRQMTDDEIKQLERLNLSARIMEISEEGNFVKDGKIYYPTSYKIREIVEQLDEDKLFYLSHRSFALIGLKMNGNKVEFGIDKEYL